ncbi:M15 family metallopeptidase [Demequina sp. SO4-18]|uniref:M15 family metallopeptidase n=1 Tax=Demequina sp. SO4-18 TaxID=3401026 RepID=UPI003B5CCAB7
MPIVTHAVGGFSVTCDAEAFAWYLRAVRAGMPLGGITSDYRDPDQQEWLFRDRYRLAYNDQDRGPYGDRRWWRGQAWVRISAKGPVAPPGSSRHETGFAIDFEWPQCQWLIDHPEFGWRRPLDADGSFSIPSEWWHYEFDKRNATAQEDDMPTADEIADAVFNRKARDGRSLGEMAKQAADASRDASSKADKIIRLTRELDARVGRVGEQNTYIIELQRKAHAAIAELEKALDAAESGDDTEEKP